MKTKMLFCIFFIITTCLFSTIINVPADQSTIQAGIDAAVDADTVLVQPGTYFENINYNGKSITVASLFLTTQDTIYISTTIIDPNYDGSVVRFESGENSSILCGFKIINACGFFPPSGIVCINSSPNLLNLIVSNNSGGGIYCEYSNPYIRNVIVTNNVHNFIPPANSSSGGGIQCLESSPYIENSIISNNHATYGGGIYCTGNESNPILKNVTISNNSGLSAAGVFAYSGSCPNLINVEIINNTASNEAGGVAVQEAEINMKNCIIKDNTADAGAGFIVMDGSATIYNNLFIGNVSNSLGSNAVQNSSITFINSIFSDNTNSAIHFIGYNTTQIEYCDFYDNQADFTGNVPDSLGVITTTNYYGDECDEFNNIFEDPMFVGTGDDPYALIENSPCIDAGIQDTTGLNLPEFDFIDNYRIWDGREDGTMFIDMGVYEFGAPPYVNIEDNVIVQSPDVFLHQNYPNPFNPITTINYSLKENSKVLLNIYNIKGQKVKQLVCDQLSAGQHSVVWNGRDENNRPVSSGVYFYKLKTDIYQKTRKMILIK